jgi:uncharacterized protein YndB with AHSA1/START domain
MPDIRHKLFIKTPVEKVYEAATTQEGLSGWWCLDTKAKPELGSIARFTFSPEYFKEMKITELKPPQSVKWACIAGYPEWIGTSISFEFKADNKGAILFFNHADWKDYTEEFAECSYNWALFLRSLRLLCETGKGLPSPNQHQ